MTLSERVWLPGSSPHLISFAPTLVQSTSVLCPLYEMLMGWSCLSLPKWHCGNGSLTKQRSVLNVSFCFVCQYIFNTVPLRYVWGCICHLPLRGSIFHIFSLPPKATRLWRHHVLFRCAIHTYYHDACDQSTGGDPQGRIPTR